MTPALAITTRPRCIEPVVSCVVWLKGCLHDATGCTTVLYNTVVQPVASCKHPFNHTTQDTTGSMHLGLVVIAKAGVTRQTFVYKQCLKQMLANICLSCVAGFTSTNNYSGPEHGVRTVRYGHYSSSMRHKQAADLTDRWTPSHTCGTSLYAVPSNVYRDKNARLVF